MSDEKLAKLLTTQKSLTEWLEDIKHKDARIIRHEDNEKRERLKVLNQLIGLPYDKPTQFTAQELANESATFKKYLDSHGEELCALRLIPTVHDLPKLRMRGKTVADAYQWFLEQNIDHSKYRADFIPHPPDYSWATIFIVNQHGIQGEIIFGGHHQLTQGFHDTEAPIVFKYDFKTWQLSPHNKDALAHLKKLAQYLHMSKESVQDELQTKLSATFSHDYLEGYFETTDSSLGTWFIDYSQALGKMYRGIDFNLDMVQGEALLRGMSAYSGIVSGKVQIVQPDELDKAFAKDAILVCPVTTPSYVPLMQKAAAIVTDQGGILSHAAIVARELKKPCIVATQTATSILKTGDMVEVNADLGTIKRLS